MITAVHTLVYADDAPAARAFFADVIGWPFVDSGDGWVIFRTGPSEMGVHPTSQEHEGQTWRTEQHHEISLMCDDLESTIADLRAKGARFTREPQDEGWGYTTMIEVPGAEPVMVYQPKHPVAHSG